MIRISMGYCASVTCNLPSLDTILWVFRWAILNWLALHRTDWRWMLLSYGALSGTTLCALVGMLSMYSEMISWLHFEKGSSVNRNGRQVYSWSFSALLLFKLYRTPVHFAWYRSYMQMNHLWLYLKGFRGIDHLGMAWALSNGKLCVYWGVLKSQLKVCSTQVLCGFLP